MTDWDLAWRENWDFWADVFNPFGYVELATNPSAEIAQEQAFHFAIKSAMLTAGAGGVWALSGGGASMGMWFGAARPTFWRMLNLKAAGYKEAAQFLYNHRVAIARGGAYAVGSYVAYRAFRSRYDTFMMTAGDDAIFHPGGSVSFRNPISGM